MLMKMLMALPNTHFLAASYMLPEKLVGIRPGTCPVRVFAKGRKDLPSFSLCYLVYLFRCRSLCGSWLPSLAQHSLEPVKTLFKLANLLETTQFKKVRKMRNILLLVTSLPPLSFLYTVNWHTFVSRFLGYVAVAF